MSFRDNLQYLRATHSLTQEQLAMMVGVSRQSVTKWEAERAYPEMDKLLKLCQIFDCTLDDLVQGDLTAAPLTAAAQARAEVMRESAGGPPQDESTCARQTPPSCGAVHRRADLRAFGHPECLRRRDRPGPGPARAPPPQEPVDERPVRHHHGAGHRGRPRASARAGMAHPYFWMAWVIGGLLCAVASIFVGTFVKDDPTE